MDCVEQGQHSPSKIMSSSLVGGIEMSMHDGSNRDYKASIVAFAHRSLVRVGRNNKQEIWTDFEVTLFQHLACNDTVLKLVANS